MTLGGGILRRSTWRSTLWLPWFRYAVILAAFSSWGFAIVTIRTPDGQEKFAIPAIDVSLVHTALELAGAEGPMD